MKLRCEQSKTPSGKFASDYLGRFIKQIRLKKALQQKDVIKRSGLCKHTLLMLENHGSRVGVDTADIIFKALGVHWGHFQRFIDKGELP